jgi:phycocyanobilin lyase subunit alpha
MYGQTAAGVNSGTEAGRRMFRYEVVGLRQSETNDQNTYPIRRSGSVFINVPYTKMNEEMVRIARMGGKIVKIEPIVLWLTNSGPSPEIVPELTAEKAIADLRGADLSQRYYAAWWLGKMRVKESVSALLLALEDREDRTDLGGYPLRRNAARALGKLGESERIAEAIPALVEALNCDDFYVREAASQSIEEIVSSSAATNSENANSETIWQSAQVAIAPLVELLQVPNALTSLTQPFEAILEALGRLKAKSAEPIVKSFLGHSLPRIRFAAARSMYSISLEPSLKSKYAEILVAGLSNPDINLRRTVLTDLGEIGYLPAVEAIASCQAENSFKLFALKRILEANLVTDSSLNSSLDSEVQELRDRRLMQVMEYMDELL